MQRAVIADDHHLYRRGTRDVIQEEFAPEVIAEAKTGTQLLNLVRESHWDLCIMDVAMPVKSGPDLVEEVVRLRPSMPILILSMHPEEHYAVRMIRSGARGYLNKSTTDSLLLVEAIRSLLAGHKFITSTVAECLADTVCAGAHASSSLHQILSNRELQIFQMLAAGKPVKEIAGALFISAATVSTYRTRVLTKLALDSNADLVRYALEHSLIT
ncbi:MAG: response regulator transcription factor [Nitrospira sp.]|nr:response regulator transcription factor [Nitrospira sp.]